MLKGSLTISSDELTRYGLELLQSNTLNDQDKYMIMEQTYIYALQSSSNLYQSDAIKTIYNNLLKKFPTSLRVMILSAMKSEKLK